MPKYRARLCPNCNYYAGFSVVKPVFKAAEIPVTSFCLNCSHRLPVYGIIRGIRRTALPLRRGTLKVAKITRHAQTAPSLESHLQEKNNVDKSIKPIRYARDLRAIGQDLENVGLRAFNLECTEASYLVWTRSGRTDVEASPLLRLSRSRLQKLWKNKPQARTQAQEEYVTQPSLPPSKRFRYSLREIDAIEREGKSQRRQGSRITDGHSLSQLLRTAGALVEQRGERLLGISWQELSVSIVVQTTQARREIDVFRPDNLYDLWVKMYLKRETRALSDSPRL
jgi:hypothetical protein